MQELHERIIEQEKAVQRLRAKFDALKAGL